MDPIVVLGVALVAGSLFAVAPLEALFCVAGASAVLAASTKRPGLALIVLAGTGLGTNAWRARDAVIRHEAAREGVAFFVPAPSRCSAHARVAESPVATHGTLRWLAALDDIQCDDPHAHASPPGAPVM